MKRRTAIWLAAALLLGGPARAEVRIKDITDLEGARNNQLYGFGLVVGLDGSGSRSLFTQQVAADMLQRLNVRATIFSAQPSDAVLRATNISAVMVTAEIGPYARPGSRLDVVVSSMDDARSLQGGTLLLTPLRGADGDVYAVAQGPLSIGGFAASGAAASVQVLNPLWVLEYSPGWSVLAQPGGQDGRRRCRDSFTVSQYSVLSTDLTRPSRNLVRNYAFSGTVPGKSGSCEAVVTSITN